MPTTNGSSWTHLQFDRVNHTHLRVTFDHPPINTITATTGAQLSESSI